MAMIMVASSLGGAAAKLQLQVAGHGAGWQRQGCQRSPALCDMHASKPCHQILAMSPKPSEATSPSPSAILATPHLILLGLQIQCLKDCKDYSSRGTL